MKLYNLCSSNFNFHCGDIGGIREITKDKPPKIDLDYLEITRVLSIMAGYNYESKSNR